MFEKILIHRANNGFIVTTLRRVDAPEDFPDYGDEYGERPGSEMLTLHFESVKAETRAAWLIVFGMDDDLNDVEHWLPKSQCSINRAANEIEVPEWLAEEKEIESYEM